MKRASVLLLLATLWTPGCGNPQGEDLSSIEQESAALWMIPGASLWPRAGAGLPVYIRVCFNGTDFTADQRTTIRRAVEDTWEKAAYLDFWDWGVCPSPAPTADVIIVSVQPSLVGLGESTGGKVAGVNRTKFRTATPTVHTIAHEFGHQLGFHDENSNDNPCTQRTGGGASLENNPDMAQSIMTQSQCNNVTSLSAWDIMGVRRMYGLKPPQTIAGLGGLALSIAGGSTADGASIIGWPAQGGSHQKWRPSSLQNLNAMVGTFPQRSRCIKGNNSSPVVSSACDLTSSERFHFLGVEWRAMGSMCIAANGATVGAGLSLQACNGNALQKWDFFEGTTTQNRIRLNGSSNLCVQVPGGTTQLGTLLNLTHCSTASEQSFTKQGGRILWGDKCFNVFGGVTEAGKPLGLWDGCTAEPPLSHSLFTISGQIRSDLGQCVAMGSFTPSDGIGIKMEQCFSAFNWNQIWETYW
jgi:hypothetical protein